MEPETLDQEKQAGGEIEKPLTPDEIADITNFIGTFYQEEIEGVMPPEEVEPGVWRYLFQDGKKIIEAMVDENTMKISTKITNPNEI